MHDAGRSLCSALACAARVRRAAATSSRPATRASPTPATAGVWSAIATDGRGRRPAATSTSTSRSDNETGNWSAMQVASSGAVALTTGDGKTATCATAFVGTGGNEPGARLPDARLYRRHEGEAGRPSSLYVECAGRRAGGRLEAGDRLLVRDRRVQLLLAVRAGRAPSSRSTSTRSPRTSRTRSRDPVEGLVEKPTDPIEAINKCDADPDDRRPGRPTGSKFAWHTENPTAYPTYVHIGMPPVIGSDGVIYGFYESPHLADTPITPGRRDGRLDDGRRRPQGRHRPRTSSSASSRRQQKNFVSHAVGLADTP